MFDSLCLCLVTAGRDRIEDSEWVSSAVLYSDLTRVPDRFVVWPLVLVAKIQSLAGNWNITGVLTGNDRATVRCELQRVTSAMLPLQQ